jgi:hypothetical protein
MATTLPTTLPQCPPLFDLESGAEYLARLAWQNGFENALEFGTVTGLKSEALIKMNDESASWLWELTGHPKAAFQRFAAPGEPIIPFGKASVKRTQLQTTGVRYCPMCIHDDIANGTPYIRGPWKWRMIGRCPDHGCPLEIDRHGVANLQSFEPLAQPPYEEGLVNSPTSDRYFMARLIEGAGNAFLDDQPAYVAAELCTLVGHLASSLQGRPLKERIPDGFENPELRQIGFEIMVKGREALTRFLETFVEVSGKRVRTPLDMFGSVLYWASINKHNPDYVNILRFFQEVAEESLPLAPGDAFIWPIKQRKVFTFATASVEYQISEKRIERILATKYDDGNMPRFLKRSEVHTLLLEGASYVTTSEAALTLGCSVTLCDALIKLGRLTAISNNEDSNRVYRLVHKSEIAAFSRRLEACVQPTLGSEGLLSFSEILRKRAYRAIDLIALVLDGAICRIASSGGTVRFDNMYFDLEEVRSAFKTRNRADVAEAELLDTQAAGRRLGVKKSTVDQLVAAKIISSQLVKIGNRQVEKVSSIDLDAFASCHITVAELARQSGADVADIVQRITSLRLSPVVEARYSADLFYKKEHFGEALLL